MIPSRTLWKVPVPEAATKVFPNWLIMPHQVIIHMDILFLDLNRFYELRLRELRPGGHLFILSPGVQNPFSPMDQGGMRVMRGWTDKIVEVLKKIAEHSGDFDVDQVKRDFAVPTVMRQIQDLAPANVGRGGWSVETGQEYFVENQELQ